MQQRRAAMDRGLKYPFTNRRSVERRKSNISESAHQQSRTTTLAVRMRRTRIVAEERRIRLRDNRMAPVRTIAS